MRRGQWIVDRCSRGSPSRRVPIGRAAAAATEPRELVLEAGPGELPLGASADTAVWAFNGTVPGPLVRVRNGDRVRVKLVNKLDQPTTLCWHGVRLPNAMDGVADLTQPPVLPGESFAYEFVPPDSGCFWYHPHVWPNSAEQIGRGLYGVLIVDEPQPPAADEDLLVVLDDWALDADGRITGDFRGAAVAQGAGRVGATLTVNSKPAPDTRTYHPGARLRLRILNACAARIALLGFAGAKATVIAIDGQPSELFEPAGGLLPIGPGSRFEVMLDLPTTPAASPPAVTLRGDGGPDRPLITFAATGAALAPHDAVAKLPGNTLLPDRIPLEKAFKHGFTIAAVTPAQKPGPGEPAWYWSLDGRSGDGVKGPPLFTVPRGAAVSLAFNNTTSLPQQMHLHGHVFRVLHDLDDGWDPFWRDSILIAPGKTKHIAFVADNPGRWMIESLTLARQVTGLAGHFIVTDATRPAPGTRKRR